MPSTNCFQQFLWRRLAALSSRVNPGGPLKRFIVDAARNSFLSEAFPPFPAEAMQEVSNLAQAV